MLYQRIKWVLIAHLAILGTATAIGIALARLDHGPMWIAAIYNACVATVLGALDLIAGLIGLLARLGRKPARPFGESWSAAFLLALGAVLLINTPLCFGLLGLAGS